MNIKISSATAVLDGTTVGIGVGQVAQSDKDILVAAIATAQGVYDDRDNKTQVQLDTATTVLDVALTTFQGKIIKAGNPSALSIAISGATALHTSAAEGIAVGQYIVGSKATLKAAIDTAQSMLDSASNKTAQQLADAKDVLDQAVVRFENNKVEAITGLPPITLVVTAIHSTAPITLKTGESLSLLSSNESVATVIGSPLGVIQVTGVAAGDSIITVQVKKDEQVIKTGTFTVTTVAPMSITSKELSTLDFSTTPATAAKLVSKPMTVNDFTDNRKDFSLRIQTANSDETVPFSLYWALSQEVSVGGAMSGVVNTAIQMHLQDKYGIEGFNRITASSWETPESSNAFNIITSETGSSAKLTLTGADWSYFFNESTAQGTDIDTTKNRTFTISDGTNTATIQLTSNFTIDALVNFINNRLMNAGVKAQAEKVGATQFKITSTSTRNIIIDGINKIDFFD